MENLVQQLRRSLTETSKSLGQLRRRKSNRVGGLLFGLTVLIGSGSQYGVSAQAVDPTSYDRKLVTG
jgi:transposase